MTRNSIYAAELKETARSNFAREQETKRNNIATLGEVKRNNIVTAGETYRHNLATEQQNKENLRETFRHNVRNENETARNNVFNNYLNLMSLSETQRHNTATEYETVRNNAANNAIGYGNVAAQYQRNANQAYGNFLTSQRDAETKRSNLAQESLRRLDLNSEINYRESMLGINRFNADTNLINAATRQRELSESIRHNQTVESEAHRRNTHEITQGYIRNANDFLTSLSKITSNILGFGG